MESKFYTTFSSSFNTFTIIWKEKKDTMLIHRIFLSDPQYKSEIIAHNSFQNIKQKSSAVINLLGKKIQEFLNGKAQNFDQNLLDFCICSPIQKEVLEAEAKIPRGWVSTYKRIAITINHPKSARVVGNALAKNPFPIIIPCHRAIKSNGEIGGFQGGSAMKRKLLEFEGIKFADNGKVILDNIYY
jgi:methylated-DNA-[protein]-cysteine S-methyltransferase